jgi:hypothetical protein
MVEGWGQRCSLEVDVKISSMMIQEADQIEGVKTIVLDPWKECCRCHDVIDLFEASNICAEILSVRMEGCMDVGKVLFCAD